MSILTGSLIAGLCFLLLISIILIRNRFQFKGLNVFKDDLESEETVAVCIPARNEENVIRRCIEHVLMQDYPNIKIYVLDDRSTDTTAEILAEFQKNQSEKLTVLRGDERPDGWLGKPWACHQLGKAASEDILLFVDADTWMEPETVSQLVRAFREKKAGFITVWPEQKLGSFAERMIVPSVYYALIGFLPVRYTERPPRWIPPAFRPKIRDKFAAACGQFMAFKNEVYRDIGGHESVRDQVVEDVELARRVIRNGHSMTMMHGVGTFYCRMYESHKELKEGFRKNFLAGFGYNIILFLLLAFLHLCAFILPPVTVLGSFFVHLPVINLFIAIMCILTAILHRLILAVWFRWPVGDALLYPLGVLWFQWLGIIVLMDYILGRKVKWKGEQV